MIPGLVLNPVGIKLTHCNFEQIVFVGVVVSVSCFFLSGLNDYFKISCSMSIWSS